MLNKRRLLLIDSSDSVRSILYNEIAKKMPNLIIEHVKWLEVRGSAVNAEIEGRVKYIP